MYTARNNSNVKSLVHKQNSISNNSTNISSSRYFSNKYEENNINRPHFLNKNVLKSDSNPRLNNTKRISTNLNSSRETSSNVKSPNRSCEYSSYRQVNKPLSAMNNINLSL